MKVDSQTFITSLLKDYKIWRWRPLIWECLQLVSLNSSDNKSWQKFSYIIDTMYWASIPSKHQGNKCAKKRYTCMRGKWDIHSLTNVWGLAWISQHSLAQYSKHFANRRYTPHASGHVFHKVWWVNVFDNDREVNITL